MLEKVQNGGLLSFGKLFQISNDLRADLFFILSNDRIRAGSQSDRIEAVKGLRIGNKDLTFHLRFQGIKAKTGSEVDIRSVTKIEL